MNHPIFVKGIETAKYAPDCSCFFLHRMFLLEKIGKVSFLSQLKNQGIEKQLRTWRLDLGVLAFKSLGVMYHRKTGVRSLEVWMEKGVNFFLYLEVREGSVTGVCRNDFDEYINLLLFIVPFEGGWKPFIRIYFQINQVKSSLEFVQGNHRQMSVFLFFEEVHLDFFSIYLKVVINLQHCSGSVYKV